MKEIFYRHFWKSWGFLRSKANDSEHDCPCCGLNLPWPQFANLSPEKVTTQMQDGQLIYRLEGTRTCPRCCHQWSAVILNDTVERYDVGAACALPTHGDLDESSRGDLEESPAWSSTAIT